MDLIHNPARLQQLQTSMSQVGIDLVALGPTVNMRYLLGFAAFADERPCFLFVGRDKVSLVVPELNADQVEAKTGMRVLRWGDAEGPHQKIREGIEQMGAFSGKVFAADNGMRADFLLVLQDVLGPRQWIPAGDVMSTLRIRKSPDEINALSEAARMADRALEAGFEACLPGVTEREVAEAIAHSFRMQGAEAVDFTIVASGPNGAFPHHETGERRLQMGEPIILDIGATRNGYKCDVTRVVHLGEPSKEVRDIYEVVLRANESGREAALPGARASQVDLAARQVIEAHGYGAYFSHRTGHGIGMDVHEPPWIRSDNDVRLEPGVVFSVEPGIYLPRRFGIRIEDIVAVTEDGNRCLTGISHSLVVK